MASSDLQQFLEDRLVALIPGIDLSAGSPAQTKFISPIITYLGTDPFDTDIGTFILDRFAQDYPDIYASDPGALRDLFVKPLQLILEPLKREIQTVRRNQSLIDPSLLSDEDADALVANVFDSRDPGGYANGVVRVYFPTPVDINVELATRIFDQQNQSFFPTNQLAVSSELMSFNREGSLFYADIPVRAESPGSSYNIAAGQIAGVEGLPNVVRATNLRKFTNGAGRQDNTTFVSAAESSLSERSLSNRRGTVARLNTVFKGQLRSTQVVGAKDPEMQRDLLVASSPGHAWITGRVSLFKNIALVLARTLEGSVSALPTPGDTLYVYLADHGSGENYFVGVSQENRLVRLRVEEVLYAGATSTTYAYSYFIRWSDPDGALLRVLGDKGYAEFMSRGPWELDGGFSKLGSIRITSAPDSGTVDVSAPNGTVHVYGHADVYVRPTTQSTSVVAINGIYDLGKLGSSSLHPHFYVERLELETVAGSVTVRDADPLFDFATAGVAVGDVLGIEDGEDAGLYTILTVTPGTYTDPPNPVMVTRSSISLDRGLAHTGTVRYRIMRSIRVDPFAPTIHRFPFGDTDPRELNTSIGQKKVTTSTVDLLGYGIQVGDTLAILEGTDSGTYTITAFDPVLGGQSIYLDKEMSGTGYNLNFSVYTELNPVQRPLVRVKELLLLDSSQQSTGVTIPAAEPVAVTPVGAFTSAGVLGVSKLSSGFVLPDLVDLLFYTDGQPLHDHGVASVVGNDARYSMEFDTPDGTYISVSFDDLKQSELDLRSDTSGKTSFFLATVESDSDSVNYPPIDPKPGECLTIKSGPNKGDYLIKAVHKFKYSASSKTMYCYFVQIYGTFPVDPIGELVSFLKDRGIATGLEVTAGSFPLSFPQFFVDFYNNLPSHLADALTAAGSFYATEANLTAIVSSMCSCTYEWGVPARGTLRTFYRDPTLFEQVTGAADEVTTYSFQGSVGEPIRFRPDPSRYQKYEIIPPRTSVDTQPVDYPTDLAPMLSMWFVAYANPLPAVGTWVTGATSGATGKILKLDTDTGRLTLSPVFDRFIQGEPVLTTTGTGTCAFESDSTIQTERSNLYTSGVRADDVLSIHAEIPLVPNLPSSGLILRTSAGSPIVKIPDALSANVFDSTMTGGILSIEQGNDTGSYRIVKVIDASSLLLDRVLTSTTEAVVRSGTGASVHLVGSKAMAAMGMTAEFSAGDIGSYLTLYGIDYRWLGSFKILAVDWSLGPSTPPLGGSGIVPGTSAGEVILELDLPSQMLASDETKFTSARWAVIADTGVPPTAIRDRGEYPAGGIIIPKGTSTLGGVPFRMYEQVAHDYRVSSAVASDSVSEITVDGEGPPIGVSQPYRVYRRNVRRLTPSEMSSQKEGPLCYFDTEVVSLSPSTTSNIPKDTYLMPDEGTYKSLGYRHVVRDPNFSYSTREEGYIDFPLKIMTDASVDSPDSLISIIGAPVQITYERADLVERVQEFADSASDRPIAGNLLVRHFLPAYVSYDATYQGGSDPSVVAKDIQSYLDQLPIETPVDVSEIEKLITGRGGNPITPTTVIATIHDWDRKMWAEFSQNYLGGPSDKTTTVPYNGSPRVTFFLPSPDVSGRDPIPSGERINLVRQ